MNKTVLLDALRKSGTIDGEFKYIAEGIRHLAIPLNTVNLNQKNERFHDERSIDAIAAMLQEFGQRVPIVVQRQGMITRDGNGRVEAARKLGWTHIAALVVDESDARSIAYAIGANRTPELSEWNMETLREEFNELSELGFDLSSLGYNNDDLENLLGEFEVEEVEPPVLDGDKPPFQQVTLTFHNEQFPVFEAAIKKAFELGYDKSKLNSHANANAITKILKAFLDG